MAVTANRYACHQNIGPAALVSAWTEVALATIVVALRFGTQFWIVKRIGLDDWIMLFALVTAILNTGLISYAVSWGLGRHFACLNHEQKMNAMK